MYHVYVYLTEKGTVSKAVSAAADMKAFLEECEKRFATAQIICCIKFDWMKCYGDENYDFVKTLPVRESSETMLADIIDDVTIQSILADWEPLEAYVHPEWLEKWAERESSEHETLGVYEHIIMELIILALIQLECI